MRTLTRRLDSRSRVSGVEGYKNGRLQDLDLPSSSGREIACVSPYPPEFWVWKRFEYARRQLHRLEPDKDGVRRRYGGSWSIPPFRKGDVVLWHDRLARVGGFMDGCRISLHSFGLKNKRFTQDAKPNECVRLFNQHLFSRQEQPQFLPPISVCKPPMCLVGE